MEARLLRTHLAVAVLLFVAATYRTPNFVVNAPTDEVAQQVGTYAEHYRRELARAWVGKELPNWYRPCSVDVKVGNVGAGGSTTFSFDHGEVFGWRMVVQGTLDRILVSVLPHEVSHTVFACHFRRPLPRWADEGAATLAEDDEEQQRQTRMLEGRLAEGRCYPLRKLFNMSEYPRDVLALYAQGFSVARFLIGQKGEATYLACLGDALRTGWDPAIKKHYGFGDVEDLEQNWVAWVNQGSPDLEPESPESTPLDPLPFAQRPKPNIIFRGQAPDESEASITDHRGPSLGKEPIALASVSGSGWRPAGAGLAHKDVPPPRAPAGPATKSNASDDAPSLTRRSNEPVSLEGALSEARTKAVSAPRDLRDPDSTTPGTARRAASNTPARRDPDDRLRVGSTKRQPLHKRIALPPGQVPVVRTIIQGEMSSVPARRPPVRRLAIGPVYSARPYSFAPT